MTDIALHPEIERLARLGAWFVFSSSGGKDSGATIDASARWLDEIGHPRDRRVSLHADLGRAEWPDTLDTVRAVAAHAGMRCETTSNRRDLLWRFDDRWRRCLLRYAALETVAVPPPWSSSDSLFCRSEQKAVQLSRWKAGLPAVGDLPVVGVIGLRREESDKRSQTPVLAPDADIMRRHRRAGLLWNPLVDWTTDQVFEHHHRHGVPLHRAYGLGSTRLSCAYCVLASIGDERVSYHAGNLAQFRSYVALETRSGFPFHPSRWLADLVGDDHTDQVLLAQAKRIAAERRRIQAEIPKDVLRAKGIANISREDAATLAGVREGVAALYGIDVVGTTADAILEMADRGG